MGRLPAPMEFEDDVFAARSGERLSVVVMMIVGVIIGLAGFGLALAAGVFG